MTMISRFFKMEAASGILLMIAALLAIILANSPLNEYYALLLSTPIEISIGALGIAKPMLLWINDGLMAIFFFLVGLELKRELVEGDLSDKKNIMLPVIGAIGGMLVPALFYWYFNHDDAVAIRGWAIPAATDIAFALGVLILLGERVPVALKVFLVSLAIFDDIGAILIIALFYTSHIALSALVVVVGCIAILIVLNKQNIVHKSPYIVLGIIMWVAMLKSGVHATLTGVILALLIPMYSKAKPTLSPVKSLEKDLHATVGFIILPIFAFANAGLNLSNIGLEQIYHDVSIGIAAGLFFGKQIGVFGFCWLAIQLGITTMPRGVNWLSLYGTSILCGIGFTMSLFIGSLAFQTAGADLLFDERLGIIFGSLASGLLGYVILHRSLPRMA